MNTYHCTERSILLHHYYKNRHSTTASVSHHHQYLCNTSNNNNSFNQITVCFTWHGKNSHITNTYHLWLLHLQYKLKRHAFINVPKQCSHSQKTLTCVTMSCKLYRLSGLEVQPLCSCVRGLCCLVQCPHQASSCSHDDLSSPLGEVSWCSCRSFMTPILTRI